MKIASKLRIRYNQTHYGKRHPTKSAIGANQEINRGLEEPFGYSSMGIERRMGYGSELLCLSLPACELNFVVR